MSELAPRRKAFLPTPFGAAAVVAVVYSLLACVFLARPGSDVARYYAPLAREFAAGNFSRAFYHLVPPLVPCCAGLLATVGIAPFAALKAVSSLFFVAALWPLRALLRRSVGAELAAWACFLYVVNPRFLRYATAGSLESAKAFFLLLTACQLAAFREHGLRRHALVAGLGLAGVCLSRGEGFLFVPVALAAVLLSGRGQGSDDRRLRELGTRAAACLLIAGVCLAAVSPWLLYQWRVTGYPCLDSRQIYSAQKVLARLGHAPAPATLHGIPAGVTDLPVEDPEDVVTFVRNVGQAVTGFFPLYVWLAAVGLVIKVRGRRAHAWCWADTLCAGVIVFNLLVFFSRGAVTKRYTAPTMPFLLGWTVLGGRWVLQQPAALFTKRPRLVTGLTRVVVAILLGTCLWKGTSKIRDSHSRRRRHPREVGRWVLAHREALDVVSHPGLSAPSRGTGYHNGRQPVVMACSPQYAYWAQGDFVHMQGAYLHSYDVFLGRATEFHVDVLVVDPAFLRACPTFDEQNRHFRLVSDEWAERGVRVYARLPETINVAELPD